MPGYFKLSSFFLPSIGTVIVNSTTAVDMAYYITALPIIIIIIIIFYPQGFGFAQLFYRKCRCYYRRAIDGDSDDSSCVRFALVATNFFCKFDIIYILKDFSMTLF